jgi:hypothetical protein
MESAVTAYNYNDVDAERVADIVMASKAGRLDASMRNKTIDKNTMRVAHEVLRQIAGCSNESRNVVFTHEEALDEARRFLSLNRRRPCMHRIHGCTELAEPQLRLCKLHGEAIRGIMI